jgi:DNA-binding PadR family transcriptional regulator
MGRIYGVTTISILNAVADGRRHGFDIIEATGLPSGTVYPALSRLEDAGYLRSGWEDARIAQQEKRPPRRYYAVTVAGRQALHTAGERYRVLGRTIGRARAARVRG